MANDAKASISKPPTRHRIRNPQDFWGGLVLIALSLFVFWACDDLPGMQGFTFGPGTAPRLFAGCLLFLAIGLVIWSFLADGESIGRFRVRGPLFVILSIMTFAAIIRPLGLLATTFVCFLIAVVASSETRWLEAIIMATCFTIGASFIFVYALSLPFELWPTY